MFTLLVGFYTDASMDRTNELRTALIKNTENKSISKVYAFVEDDTDIDCEILKLPKIEIVRVFQRMTYKKYFSFARSTGTQAPFIIANADIYLDETLALLREYDLSGKFLALSRWEKTPDGLKYTASHVCSQDAWIFLPKIPAFFGDFHLGVPGCDNRILWEAENAGLKILNPSKTIRAIHLHESRASHYVGRVNEPHRLLGGHEL